MSDSFLYGSSHVHTCSLLYTAFKYFKPHPQTYQNVIESNTFFTAFKFRVMLQASSRPEHSGTLTG